MIEVQRVTKLYGRKVVLDGADLEVRPGELVLLLGANGAGKSTLLRCILGLVPYEGRIRVDGLDPLLEGARVRARIGYMPQADGLHGDMTVAEIVRFYAAIQYVEERRAAALIEEVELVDMLDIVVDELSGGMRQRLAFALAMLANPRVLLLDEPTASLDRDGRLAMCERLRTLADAGHSILLSTHAPAGLPGMADRAVTLCDGKILGQAHEGSEPGIDEALLALLGATRGEGEAGARGGTR